MRQHAALIEYHRSPGEVKHLLPGRCAARTADTWQVVLLRTAPVDTVMWTGSGCAVRLCASAAVHSALTKCMSSTYTCHAHCFVNPLQAPAECSGLLPEDIPASHHHSRGQHSVPLSNSMTVDATTQHARFRELCTYTAQRQRLRVRRGQGGRRSREP